MRNPFEIVRDFEEAVGEYTGAPHVVAVNSCTMALLLSLIWWGEQHPTTAYIEIPKRTYVSVPMSIMHARFSVMFRDEDWSSRGFYQLSPFPIYDSARWFTNGMYFGGFVCVSFHTTKILGDTQGGAILLDNAEAADWLRRMRFDGRTEGVPPSQDMFTDLGWHCYMSPDVAARLMHRLMVLPRDNKPLPMDDYPDLSQVELFK